MSLMDSVSSLVNAVNGGSSGGSSATGTPVWRVGNPYLLTSSGSGAGQVCPNNTNQFNLQDPLVFLHYGRFHLDSVADFSGASSGAGAGNGGGSLNRGVVYRDCLIREAILLHGFIFSTRAMMQQFASEKGWMGEASAAIGMVSNLLEGGPPPPKPPDPDQLDKLMQRVKDAATKFNVTPVTYQAVNVAGKTLHQIRADYGAFLDQLADFYVAPPSSSQGGGIMGTVTGAITRGLLYIPIIGQFANAFTKIAEVLPVLHLTTAWALEQGLADQSYALSMLALQPEQAVPKTTFPLWDTSSSGSGSNSVSGSGKLGDTPLNQALAIVSGGDANRKSMDDALLAGIADAQKKTLTDQFTKRCRQWYPPPDALAHAFIQGTGITDIPGLEWGGAALQGVSSTVSKKVFETSSSSGGGSSSSGGGGTFMERFLAKRASGIIDFVKDVYLAIHQQPTAPISADFLRKVGTDALVDMIWDMVQQIVKIPDPTEGILNKLNPESRIETWVSNENNKWVNQAINYLIISSSNGNSMLSILQEAQKTATSGSGVTMEVYLSRLPWIVTTMFHQTFFSVFAQLLENTVGKNYQTVVNQLTWVRGMNSKVDNESQSLSGSVKKYSSMAGDAGGAAGLLGSSKSGSGIAGILSKATGVIGVTGPSFPFTKRVSGGTATAVTADDLSTSGIGTAADFPASGSGSANGYYIFNFNSTSGSGTPTPDKYYPAFPGGAGSHPSSGSGSGAGSGSGSATGPAGLYGLPL